MQQLNDFISHQLNNWAVNASDNHILTTLIAVTLAVLFSWLVYQFLTRVVGKIVLRFVEYTAVKWDDVLLNPKVLRSVWRFVFALMLHATVPGSLTLYPGAVGFVTSLCSILIVGAVMMILVRLVSALYELTLENDRFKSHSLKGIFQMVQLVVILVGVIVVISIIIGRDPVFVLSGLGAAAAIIMLVFQDTILGLVAGIQLSVNDMLRPGDWISAPKCNANGTVLEVTLTTVKVQNFDMTIITIPPYTLVKESFQNWRGMTDARGRRVMRSINIDMTTIRRLTTEEAAGMYAQEWATDDVRKECGETPVNLTLFRHYLTWLIMKLPSERSDMTAMVRELQPTPDGLPVEVYFFTSRYDWPSYEKVQAALFDEILADVHRFGLRVFQNPTGHDIRRPLP